MTRTPANSGGKQDTRFKPGRSGNPTGKKPGTRHRATLAAEALLEGEAEALTRKALELALSGDTVALRLCLDRLVPPRKDRPVSFRLPPLETAGDAPRAIATITAAVAAGDLTPAEAGDLSALVERFARAVETAELEARIAALEERSGNG